MRYVEPQCPRCGEKRLRSTVQVTVEGRIIGRIDDGTQPSVRHSPHITDVIDTNPYQGQAVSDYETDMIECVSCGNVTTISELTRQLND